MSDFTSQYQYCKIADVQDRGLISTVNTNYNTAVTNAILEASRLVDNFMSPYVTPPLGDVNGTDDLSAPPDQIIYITADFAMSIFKRRYTPTEVKGKFPMSPDMINDTDGTGWFALGLRKILDYIKSTYGLGPAASPNTPESGGITTNPEIFKDLFAKGLLTLQEARRYMANPAATISEVINKIFTTSDTKVVAYLETQNIHYMTKAQKAFGFISGKKVSYNTLGGYILDSDSQAEGGSSE